MNTKNETRYDIVNGPNRDALFDNCKYAMDKGINIPVEFDVAFGYTKPKDDPGCVYIKMAVSNVRIVAIEHEDGSGNSFNLRGLCSANLKPIGPNGPVAKRAYKFEAYYNAKTRKGTIKFID